MTMTNAATEYKLPVMATSGAEDKEVVPLDRATLRQVGGRSIAGPVRVV